MGTPKNTSTVQIADLANALTKSEEVYSSYVGYSDNLANRVRSQFRGQVVMPNLQGPVYQVLSFVPANVLMSKNTDANLSSALWWYRPVQGDVPLYLNFNSMAQFTLGYVLSFATTLPSSTYMSQPRNLQVGTEVLQQSCIAPIFGPLVSTKPNVIWHFPNIFDANNPNKESNHWIVAAVTPMRGTVSSNKPSLTNGYY